MFQNELDIHIDKLREGNLNRALGSPFGELFRNKAGTIDKNLPIRDFTSPKVVDKIRNWDMPHIHFWVPHR